MAIERVIEITAAKERVWATLTDVERWPEWTASMMSVRRLDQGQFRVGSRAHIRQPRLPVATWAVTVLDPGHYFEWQSSAFGLRTIAGHRVAATGDRASRVTLWVTWRGLLAPVVRVLYGKLARRYVAMEAQGLKRRCEAA